MESFVVAVTAVTPFLIYMLYGFIMRRAGVTDEAFLNRLNKVIFRCFYPFLSFYNIYSIDPDLKFRISFVLFGTGLALILVVVLLLTVPRVVKDKKQAGSFIQAVYRSNAVLYALPLTQSVYGQDGASLSAMLIALLVPFYNVAAVLILEYFGGQKASSRKALFKSVLTNPIIIGAIVGIFCYVLKIHFPEALNKPFNAFNQLTTPMAMFVLGGSLHFSETGRYKKLLISGLALRLVIIPALALLATIAAGFSPAERFAIFACFATPSAAASYSMASSMGCDGELAGQFVVIGTVLSLFTLFLWIYLIGQAGLL
ncbi:MAG: AEC family transporter [Lachnospiraceae bacterium]|nr:AEC family transporter [Lachnospiraceae bacterium]